MSITNENLPQSMRFGLMNATAVEANSMLARYSSVNGSTYSPTTSNEILLKVKANGFLEGSKHYLSFTVTNAAAAAFVDTHAGSFFERVTISCQGSIVEQIQSYGLYNAIRNTYNTPLHKIFSNAVASGSSQLAIKETAVAGTVRPAQSGALGEGFTIGHSKVFCIQLESGLLKNHLNKALPDGCQELDITLRLAGNNQAQVGVTATAPTYTISDVSLYAPVYQILNGDVMASYRSVVAQEGLMWSGDTAKTYINSMSNGAGTKTLQINDRSLSCKGMVTAFRDEGVDNVIDKYANGSYGFSDGTGSITSYIYRFGSENKPAQDVNINTAVNGENFGRVHEETLKALAKHGEMYAEGTVDRFQLRGSILGIYTSATNSNSLDVPKGLVSVDLKKCTGDGLKMVGMNTAQSSSPNVLEVTHTLLHGALSATTFAIVECFFSMNAQGTLTSVM